MWRAVTGGLVAGAIGVTAFAGATASADPLQPAPPNPGAATPAPAQQNITSLPGGTPGGANTNRLLTTPPGSSPAASPVPSAAPVPGTAAAQPPTVAPPVTGTLRDYLQANGVKLEAQSPQGLKGLEITLPMPPRWTQVPDPNVPDAFAVIADRLGTSLYTSNAQVVVYKLVGKFDPKEAITHGYADSQRLLAWQTTKGSQADFMGYPSSVIEGTYRQDDMALNTSRRHVIVTSGADRYLVSLSVTTALSQAVADGPATNAIINGFRVTASGAPAAAPTRVPGAAPVAPGQTTVNAAAAGLPAPASATPPAALPAPAVATPPAGLPAPAVATPPAGLPAPAVATPPAALPAPAVATPPAGLPAQAPVPGQSLTPQPTPNLLALLPGLPPLPNLHLNLLGAAPR